MSQSHRVYRLTQFVLVIALVFACAADHGLFRSITFDEALAAAKKEQKIVLVDFFATWCGPCKLLDTTTWKDPEVLQWAGQNCVAVKIDAEENVELAQRFKLEGYPTIVLLEDDGSEITRLVGYRDAQQFLADANRALAARDGVKRLKARQ